MGVYEYIEGSVMLSFLIILHSGDVQSSAYYWGLYHHLSLPC